VLRRRGGIASRWLPLSAEKRSHGKESLNVRSLALLLLLSACASPSQSLLDRTQKHLEALESDADFERIDPLQSPVAATAPPQPHLKDLSPACLAAYENLYRNDSLEIHVAFGYKDARPARFVGDRYERIVFIQHLSAPCHDDDFACGFHRDGDDADLLSKEIIGPDGNPRTVNIRITNSSVGPDDNENRENLFQRWQSRHSQKNFLQGLRSADVVFYNGHSRDGGGPDFSPPRLRSNDHVDYAWYIRNKPGVQNMIEALRESDEAPKALGLFSCVSDKHFARQIWQIAPATALITSRKLLYYADAIASSLGALNAILGMWCEPAFEKSIQAHPDRKDSKLDRFFAKKSGQAQPAAEGKKPAGDAG
jgi:hypothetical protein